MKTSLLILVLATLSQVAFATSYEFDCGKNLNIPRTLSVKSKTPGEDGYEFAAVYKAKGLDSTTGTVVQKTYDLVGQSDIVVEDGKDIPILAFLNYENPNFQVVLHKTTKIGAIVPALEINLATEEIIEFNCTLKSYNK
ncbi:MAG: hypothetical protein K2Q18_11475 [Bdellovibrionales bacterium]|nr:hypothetical protein [Bdellovibrionales bacterium]